MPENPIIDVIIPVFNEEDSISLVIQDIPKDLVRHIIVANNNSTDNSAEQAENAGAIVVHQVEKGYGAACLKALSYIENLDTKPDILVFLDGDYSDYPEEMRQLVEPIRQNKVDLVIGSRALGNKEQGAMLPQAIFGNKLAVFLIRMFYGYKFTDLGPFRAVRYSTFKSLNMKDRNFGWTVELQVKAAKKGIPFTEIPVSYRKRIGKSKVSGTIS